MQAQFKTALLAGATGMIGKQLMYQLLEQEMYSKIIILVRRPYTITHPKLEQIIIDFNQIQNFNLNTTVDHAFCCLGTTMKNAGSKDKFYQVDYTYTLGFAQLAMVAQANTLLLVSANGANSSSAIYYSSVKGKIEEAIAKLSFKSVYVFRPSLLLGDRQEFRMGELLATWVSKLISPFMIGFLKRYKPIEAIAVAKSMVKNARKSDEGFTVLENEMI